MLGDAPLRLRDKENNSLLPRHGVRGSPTSQKHPHQHQQLAGSTRSKAVAADAHLRHQRITQALAKQRVKRLAAYFAAWQNETKQGQVHLKGAHSMLQWRKLLRIWKVGLPCVDKLCCVIQTCTDQSDI